MLFLDWIHRNTISFLHVQLKIYEHAEIIYTPRCSFSYSYPFLSLSLSLSPHWKLKSIS
jgi:hypothetical protein